MENRLVAQDQMAVAEFGRDQNLKSVAVGQDKRLPFPEGIGICVAVDDDKIKFSPKAGNQLPSVLVPVNSPQDEFARYGYVVLHKLDVNPLFLINRPIVCLEIPAAVVFKRVGLD